MKMRVLGLTFGMVFGITALAVAQAVPRFSVGTTLECAYNQAAASLSEAQSTRVEFQIAKDGAPLVPPTVVTPVCSGSTSPFNCLFTLPAASTAQPGNYLMTYRSGNLEFDSTVTYGSPITNAYAVDPALRGAPAQPTNSVIRKFIKAMGSMFGWIGQFFS